MNHMERPHIRQSRQTLDQWTELQKEYSWEDKEQLKLWCETDHLGEVDDGSVNKVPSSQMFLPEGVILWHDFLHTAYLFIWL
jgi:hypothetical protein